MFENIENINPTFSRISHGICEKTVNKRKHHLFAIRISGSTNYCFEDKILNSTKGTLTFIPKGYGYHFIPDKNNSVSLAINFEADIKNAKPEIYDISGFSDYDKIVRSFARLWSAKTPSTSHRCLSLFHSLIAYLIDIENIKYADKRKHKLINPALCYIENHLTDTGLKTDKLHLECGISAAYFRRIFRVNLGISPQKYIEEKRLELACNILEDDYSKSIGEIATLCGYNAPLYFGKVFKKKYGTSPSYFKYE